MTIVTKQSVDTLRELLVSRVLDCIHKGVPVVLLLSGGSAAPIGAAVCRELEEGMNKPGISSSVPPDCRVSLVDERFGPAGHADSNWLYLEKQIPDWKFLKPVPVLTGTTATDEDFRITTETFDRFLSQTVQRHQTEGVFVAAIFGIGEDGHTAGILPESPAACMAPDGGRYGTSYRSIPHLRITMAPSFFHHIDLALVWAAGPEKIKVIDSLQRELPLAIQPAQLLKLAKETLLFTDQETINT